MRTPKAARPDLVVARYDDQLHDLARRLNWPLHIRKAAHQQNFQRLAKELLPADWALLKEPQC